MNKKKAIEKINDLWSFTLEEEEPFNIDLINKRMVIEIISQINEPQKVMVPKFVAEWIEEAKAEGYTLYTAFDLLDGDSRSFDWLFDGHESNQETFARAWLDGYEVEKEKLYTVEIPNPNSAGGKLVLFKQQSTGRLILDMLNPNINKPKYLHLTESEIKQDFEWAWQWAKPVEVE